MRYFGVGWCSVSEREEWGERRDELCDKHKHTKPWPFRILKLITAPDYSHSMRFECETDKDRPKPKKTSKINF